MDTLFLVILLMSTVLTVLLIGNGIVWCLEHLTWRRALIGFSLIITIGILTATAYALWIAFGWWWIAYIGISLTHGFCINWYVFHANKPFLDQPILKIGDENVTPPLHR